MANKAKKKRTAQAQAQAKARALARQENRQPVGTPNVPLVKKAGKKKATPKGMAAGKAQVASILLKKGMAPWDQVVDRVEEDGIFRHHAVSKAHADAVMSIVMTEDAVYTASRDKALKRWKPQQNAQGRFELLPDVEVPLGEIAWCLVSAGEWLFCGLGSGEIKGFSKTGKEIKLEGHTKRVSSLLVHQHVLISGSADATVRFWQLDPASQTFVCTHCISEGIAGSVSSLCILKEGLWVGGSAGVTLVELATLKVVMQIEPKKPVAGLLIFTDFMIVVYTDGSMRIFTALGAQTHSQSPLPAGPVLSVAGLDAGPRVLCGHSKGKVSSISLPNFQLQSSWQTLQRCKVQSITCAGHDGIFLVGAENGDLQLWQRLNTVPP